MWMNVTPLNSVSESQLSPLSGAIKRTMDICGALIGLLLLTILLPLIALLIISEDRGPIFYKQKRVGHKLKPFYVYKLRSMRIDADEYLNRHPALRKEWETSGKLHNDPRVTRIGNFLRRSSLDELPQMWNILRGDMSLVGPRAIQYSEIAVFGELIELRQQAKPGLTGLWQISGRSMTSYEQRCILDCIYVTEGSIWLDGYILLKTIPSVLAAAGAI